MITTQNLESFPAFSVISTHTCRMGLIRGRRAPEKIADAVEDALRCLIRQWRADLPSTQQLGNLGVLLIQAVTIGQ